MTLPLGIALAAAASACGGGDGPADANTQLDAFVAPDVRGPGEDAPASSGLGTCAAPRMVTLSLDAPQTVTGNTAGGPAGPLPLGPDCGNPMATASAPQEVLAIEVPGSGEVGIAFDLTGATVDTFDTVVQVRTACETVPPDETSCFDDAELGEVRSAGSFVATGGSTVYLVVTGFPMGPDGTMSSGPYSMEILAEANAAPTLTAASARKVADDRLEIFSTGMDPDGNAVGVGVRLLGAGGMPIPADAAAPDDLGPYFFAFDDGVTGISFTDALATAPGSADLDGVGAATGLRVFVFDRYGVRSATRDVMIDTVSEAAFGESCDATRVCRLPNACEAGICAASAPTLALCGSATAVTLDLPVGSSPTVLSQTVTLVAGPGTASPTGCADGALGAEQVLAVTVPAGAFDLIAATNLAANPIDLDTVVYVRSTCANDASELTCDDDYTDAPEGDYRSNATVENASEGTHFVFVDGYDPFDASTTVAVELRLRPLLASGATCDAMGLMNRCMAGACPASGAAVCP